MLLVSLILYGVFVYAVASRRLLPPLAGPRRTTSTATRCVTALIMWPILGFLLFWFGVLASTVGGIMMLPVGVAWHMLFPA